MIGQNKIIEKFNSFNLDNCPHSIILSGDLGSGRHSLAYMLCDNLGIEVEDISDSISLDYINEINLRVEPKGYIIDANKILDKHQNMILKFLEEPTTTTYIIIICNSTNDLLQTVKNRCTSFELNKYTLSELQQFTSNEKILSVASTPGQIKLFESIDIEYLIELVRKFIDNINKSTTSTASILQGMSSKFNFKDDEDTLLYLFLKLLINELLIILQTNFSDNIYNMYRYTNELLSDIRNKPLRKDYLFDKYILDLR